MSGIQSYKELLVWQKGIHLVTTVYKNMQDFPNDENFGLKSQIKRAAVSIPSNIAEGWGRNSTQSYSQFLKISRGSLFELETQKSLQKN